jgi:hypothetical protein
MAATQHLTKGVDGVLRLKSPNLSHQRALRARDRVGEVYVPRHLRVGVANGFQSVQVGVG